MAESHRILGVTLAQIFHAARVELHVGAADPDPGDVHDDLAHACSGRLEIEDRRRSWAGHDECPQCPDQAATGRRQGQTNATLEVNTFTPTLCSTSAAGRKSTNYPRRSPTRSALTCHSRAVVAVSYEDLCDSLALRLAKYWPVTPSASGELAR